MQFDDFGGGLWGGLGGFVKWFKDREGKSLQDKLINLVGSISTAIGFGNLFVQAMLYACPNVPRSLSEGLALIPGIGGGILLQWSVRLVSGLADQWYPHLMRLLGPRGTTNGTTADASGPAGDAAGTPAVVVGVGVSVGPVHDQHVGERVPAGAAGGGAEAAG